MGGDPKAQQMYLHANFWIWSSGDSVWIVMETDNVGWKDKERSTVCFRLHRVQGSYLRSYGIFQSLPVSEINVNMWIVAFPTSPLWRKSNSLKRLSQVKVTTHSFLTTFPLKGVPDLAYSLDGWWRATSSWFNFTRFIYVFAKFRCLRNMCLSSFWNE
jgi:hypothetical protein